jgi:hypothetical protein
MPLLRATSGAVILAGLAVVRRVLPTSRLGAACCSGFAGIFLGLGVLLRPIGWRRGFHGLILIKNEFVVTSKFTNVLWRVARSALATRVPLF